MKIGVVDTIYGKHEVSLLRHYFYTVTVGATTHRQQDILTEGDSSSKYVNLLMQESGYLYLLALLFDQSQCSVQCRFCSNDDL